MSRSQPVCLQIYSSSLGSDLTESQRETQEVGGSAEEGREKVEGSKEGTGEEDEETENFS